MAMTNDEMATKLVKGFKAYLAHVGLSADPDAIKGSNLFHFMEPATRDEFIRLVEQKVRDEIQADLAGSFEGFKK